MKGFLVFLLIVSIFVNAFLLLFERTPQEVIYEKIPTAEMNQIREIAIACGTNPAKVSNMSAKEMLSDIKSTLLNAEPYYGAVLIDKELSTVQAYLNNKKEILKIIEFQNKYLSDLKGKRILLLPANGK